MKLLLNRSKLYSSVFASTNLNLLNIINIIMNKLSITAIIICLEIFCFYFNNYYLPLFLSWPFSFKEKYFLGKNLFLLL